MTEDNKNICRQLYQEYKTLSDKTASVVGSYESEKNPKSQPAILQDILKKEELRKKLLEKCKDYLKTELTPEELFDIENG